MDAQIEETVYYDLSRCFFTLPSVITVQWKGMKHSDADLTQPADD